jgi:hypothetical protein
VRVPFYYDTLNLEIDNILMLACIDEINIILSNYGYKTYVSLEPDTSVEPLRVNMGITNEDSIIMNVDLHPSILKLRQVSNEVQEVVILHDSIEDCARL